MINIIYKYNKIFIIIYSVRIVYKKNIKEHYNKNVHTI